jgi:hypothetical protein
MRTRIKNQLDSIVKNEGLTGSRILKAKRRQQIEALLWSCRSSLSIEPHAPAVAFAFHRLRSGPFEGPATESLRLWPEDPLLDGRTAGQGALERFLFRVGFLDRDYPAMMRGVLNEYKTMAEPTPLSGNTGYLRQCAHRRRGRRFRVPVFQSAHRFPSNESPTEGRCQLLEVTCRYKSL